MTDTHIYNHYHRSFACVDLDAIDHNLCELKARLNEGVKALAVVKADAYGHGSVVVSKHIEDKVDYFAVATIEEAITIRDGGIKKPILVLSFTSPYQYEALIEKKITATIFNVDEAKILSDMAVKKGKKAKIHVPVDTGMGRIGFTPDEKGADAVREISLLEGVELEGLFSHYACADCEDKTDALQQTKLFDLFIELLNKRNVEIPIKHICNSAGTMEFTKQYDMCRMGVALYGLYPSDEVKKDKVKLLPAMEVVSHVIHVKTVPQGFKIGYGHIYEAPSERRIATICIGYADGYKRCLTGVGYVLIHGKKAPVVGKVCMDQIMVDITDIPDAKVGDHAVVMGKSLDAEISAETLGEMCHSFNYEVVCNFMPRVTRVYYKDGKII